MTNLNGTKQQPGEEDLSWLARNVHGWGDNIALMGRILRNGEYSPVSTAGAAPKGVMWFTRDQWLTRRAELQNKPDWKKDAPEWAEWLAQHSIGRWTWYEEEPCHDDNGFWVDGGACQCAGKTGEVLCDWRDTLERRPQVEAEITDPFDPEFRKEPSIDDWDRLGGLPPTGVLARLVFKGDYAYDCEVVAVRGEYVVLWCADTYMSEAIKLEDCRFEPIQTERERVASELVDVMMAVPVGDRKTPSESFMSMALAIYDHLYPENKS